MFLSEAPGTWRQGFEMKGSKGRNILVVLKLGWSRETGMREHESALTIDEVMEEVMSEKRAAFAPSAISHF